MGILTVCSECGKTLQIGDFPFCPHSPTSAAAITTHEIPGGLILENYGPEPIKVYSHTERRRIMAERGIRESEKFCPTPGTDKDPGGIPNPKGYIDAQTLANAAALLERVGGGHRDRETFDSDGVIVNQTTEVRERLSDAELRDYLAK